MLRFHNTLTRQKEEFKPMEAGKVRMYVCGPTVYDVPHIGHARSAFSFDVLRRYLEYSGLEVYFVRNVTDIDDKIIRKAVKELADEGKDPGSPVLKERVREVAERYLKVYHDELDHFGIKPPSAEPRATEHIADMISFIDVLIEKGHAYVSGGGVFFDVNSFEKYGRLSNRDVEQLLSGARVDKDERKRSPLDFALWKEAKEHEPSWESPWGQGRPGWHIECSVMSTKLMGPSFDIHGGGLDLIFPHHENEIAQAEACTGHPFANYWIHNGLLTVNGEKMSKSLGNYITIEAHLEEHPDPDLLKMAFLMSHYRSPMDYSSEKMESAASARERIMIFLEKADKECPKDTCEQEQKALEELRQGFSGAMDDDLNTAGALSVIFESVRKGNALISSGRPAGILAAGIKDTASVLGLELKAAVLDDSSVAEIEELVARRQNLKDEKRYSEADAVRDKLAAMGVVVEDTPEGPVWRRH